MRDKLFRNLAALLVLGVFALFSTSALAEEPVQTAPLTQPVVESAVIDATLSPQNTLAVNETITVDLPAGTTYFTLTLPARYSLSKNVAGDEVSIRYRAVVSSVYAEDVPFEASEKGDSYLIKLGDGTAMEGKKVFRIRYLYDAGDDRISSYDDFFYSFAGSAAPCEIKQLTLSLTFPKKTDLTDFRLYTGAFGSLSGGSAVPFTVDGQTIRASASVKAGETLTGYVKLPKGYYSGARKPAAWPIFLSAAAAAGLFVLLLFLLGKTAKTAPAATAPPEQPPVDLSSAEAAFLHQKGVGRRGASSLLLWLAAHGSLSIRQNGDAFTLIQGPAPQSATPAAAAFYEALFQNGTEVSLTDPAVLEAPLQAAGHPTEAFFSGERSLHKKSGALLGLVLMPLAFLPSAFALGFSGLGLAPQSWAYAAAFGVLAFLFGLFLRAAQLKGLSAGRRALWVAAAALAAAGAVFMPILCARLELTPLAFLLPVALLGLAAEGMAALYHPATGYAAEQRQRFEEVERFFQKADLPTLRRCMETDPFYFWQMLPYAFAFDVAERWAHRFDLLQVAPPPWIESDKALSPLQFALAFEKAVLKKPAPVKELPAEETLPAEGEALTEGEAPALPESGEAPAEEQPPEAVPEAPSSMAAAEKEAAPLPLQGEQPPEAAAQEAPAENEKPGAEPPVKLSKEQNK